MSAILQISDLLFARLKALVFTPAIPIAWPNTKFTPPASLWLRPTIIPAAQNPISLNIDGTNEILGIFQIDVFSPLQSGEKGEMIASQIAGQFRRGTKLLGSLARVEVRNVLVTQGRSDTVNWQVPVSVSYRAFVLNA